MLAVIGASGEVTLYVYRRRPVRRVFQKIVCPMKPSSRCAASSDSSSRRDRDGSKCRQVIAVKHESQYHCHG